MGTARAPPQSRRTDWKTPLLPLTLNYSDAPSDGTAFEEGPASRVLRGGSWINGARYLRVSIRSRWFEDSGRPFIGFRCARDAEATQD